MRVDTFVAGIIVAVACALQAVAGSPAVQAMQNRDEWLRDRLLQCRLNPLPPGTAEAQPPVQDHRPASQSIESIRRTSRLPFAFQYAGRTSDDLLAGWPKQTDSR